MFIFKELLSINLLVMLSKFECKKYHIYIITDKYRKRRNKYKIGKHKGSKDALYDRYKTSLINPIICYFIEVTNHTLIETLVKRQLDEYRVKYKKDGGKSEWIKLDLSKIIKCIKTNLHKDEKIKPVVEDKRIRRDPNNKIRDILLRKTNVSYDFITDFVDWLDESNKMYCYINYTIAIKWLVIRKYDFKYTLVKNFSQNDYFIYNVKSNSPRRGGHNNEDIWVTPECFKEYCINSIMPRHKEIRKQFLILEECLNNINN